MTTAPNLPADMPAATPDDLPVTPDGHPSMNGLGLAGLLLSILAVLTAGCMLPLALIFVFAGLSRRPRGTAIAGLTICSLFIATVVTAAGTLFLIAMPATQLIDSKFGGKNLEVTFDFLTLATKLDTSGGKPLPDDLAAWDGVDAASELRIDPWNNAYVLEDAPPRFSRNDGPDRYALDFDLRSAGPDGTLETDDDIMLSTLGTTLELSDVRIGRQDDGRVTARAGRLELRASETRGSMQLRVFGLKIGEVWSDFAFVGTAGGTPGTAIGSEADAPGDDATDAADPTETTPDDVERTEDLDGAERPDSP